MHGDDDFRQPPRRAGSLQFGFERGNRHIQCGGVDIDKIDIRAAVERAVGRGGEGDGRGPQHIARAQPERKAGQMQGGSGAVYRHGMRGAAIGFQAAFKGRHLRALGEKVGLEDGKDGVDIVLGNGLAAVGDHGESSRKVGRGRQPEKPVLPFSGCLAAGRRYCSKSPPAGQGGRRLLMRRGSLKASGRNAFAI